MPEILDNVVIGAIYRFAAWLTQRDESITLGSSHDAAPAADAVKEFIIAENLDPRVNPDHNWKYRCTPYLNKSLPLETQK